MADVMSTAIYGLQAQSDRMSSIGNNVANSQTTGYKNNRISFQENFYRAVGNFANGKSNQYGNGVGTSGTRTDWTPGALEETGQMGHVSIQGRGFLPVANQHSDNGNVESTDASANPAANVAHEDVDFTRSGDFKLTKNTSGGNVEAYTLTRPDGSHLVGYDNTGSDDDVSNDRWGTLQFVYEDSDTGNVNPAVPDEFAIKGDGSISVSGQVTDSVGNQRDIKVGIPDPSGTNDVRIADDPKIAIKKFANPDALTRTSSGNFTTDKGVIASKNTDGDGDKVSWLTPGDAKSGSLRQGMLEQSNVSLEEEFTDMITTQRAYQANSRTISTANKMNQEVLRIVR